MVRETENRKVDHIRISLNQNVQARNVTAGFEDVNFIHRALPEIDRGKIDLATRIFGHQFSAPLLVGAMTGGSRYATKINANIAETVEQLGLGMGVGSQRAALEDKRVEETFTVARKKAPKAFLIANIGAIQLKNGYDVQEVRRAIDMIEADAVAIHMNALQETAQPEGQTNFGDLLQRIKEVAEEVDKPIIAKETGAGIASDEARKLETAGVKGIDVSGAGGTSFAAVEYHRAKQHENELQQRLGSLFWDWGIPTVASIVEVAQTCYVPIIGSGGLRSGVDAAKALALGASLASFSQPILRAAVKSVRETLKTLTLFTDELRNTMFLVGADSIETLRKTSIVIRGRTSQWLRTRGFEVESYAQRRRN